jgi:hypothetical protein
MEFDSAKKNAWRVNAIPTGAFSCRVLYYTGVSSNTGSGRAHPPAAVDFKRDDAAVAQSRPSETQTVVREYHL